MWRMPTSTTRSPIPATTSTHRAAIVGHITIRHAEKWRRYLDGVPGSLVPFDAEVVMRGKQQAALNGEQHGTDLVVIRFPDLATVEAWYRSASYQALIPLRDEAADVVLTVYAI